MTQTNVKICGLQSVEVIKSIINFPVDFVGFVFAKSKRQVTAQAAGDMIRELHAIRNGAEKPYTVGVFVNPTRDDLVETLRYAPLDYIQLHQQETPEFCGWVKRDLSKKVIKTISIQGEQTAQAVQELLDPYHDNADILLLDTFDLVIGGGTGKTFSWEHIPLYQEWAAQAGIPLWIAGGLDADNVGTLIADFHPDGVDVSSSVETDGMKDLDKIKAFVERVKS
ncbi:MAG: N-(5'-phosphoribosyl)anthranilate isomerase [Paenibacillus sp. RIFOXYA1_FULL_44_5]|nr:MAG: N-(5'-phosphoribosyl)anthranilate isomerase [Paenibacillus sp. RIFOXYA1_FULL_44_5]